MNIPDGIIRIDSEFGQSIGFISSGFDEGSYMWGIPSENTIIVTVVISKVKGAFRNLIQCIEANGWKFQIPTPSKRIREIGKKQGWVSKTIYDKKMGQVEYLTKG